MWTNCIICSIELPCSMEEPQAAKVDRSDRTHPWLICFFLTSTSYTSKILESPLNLEGSGSNTKIHNHEVVV